jgi:hypothetical protein
MICENRVLREILEPKRNEVTGGWRILHNEQLHNLNSSPNIRVIGISKSRRVTFAGHEARMEEERNTYRVLVRKP